MKLHGDIPQEHKELEKNLIEQEKEVELYKNHLPTSTLAKFHVCLAHDWIEIGLEEEGHRLLLKAEEAHPSYFEKDISLDMQESEDYKYLVGHTITMLADLFISGIRSK